MFTFRLHLPSSNAHFKFTFKTPNNLITLLNINQISECISIFHTVHYSVLMPKFTQHSKLFMSVFSFIFYSFRFNSIDFQYLNHFQLSAITFNKYLFRLIGVSCILLVSEYISCKEHLVFFAFRNCESNLKSRYFRLFPFCHPPIFSYCNKNNLHYDYQSFALSGFCSNHLQIGPQKRWLWHE